MMGGNMGRTGQVTGGMKAQDGSRETHVPVERPLRPRRACKSCCKLGRGEFSAVVVLFVSKSKSRERGEQSAMHVAVGVLSFRNQQHKNRGRGHHESDGRAGPGWMGRGRAMRCGQRRLLLSWSGPRGCGGGGRGTGEGGGVGKLSLLAGRPPRSSADRRRLLGVSVWWDDAGSLQVQACRLLFYLRDQL